MVVVLLLVWTFSTNPRGFGASGVEETIPFWPSIFGHLWFLHHLTQGSVEWAGRLMEGGDSVLPFVIQFYGSPTSYLWKDSEGVVHEVLQGEGGEKGDALMPALFSLEHHDALVAFQDRLAPDERLMAFLDDIFTVGDRPRAHSSSLHRDPGGVEDPHRPTQASKCTKGKHCCGIEPESHQHAVQL